MPTQPLYTALVSSSAAGGAGEQDPGLGAGARGGFPGEGAAVHGVREGAVAAVPPGEREGETGAGECEAERAASRPGGASAVLNTSLAVTLPCTGGGTAPAAAWGSVFSLSARSGSACSHCSSTAGLASIAISVCVCRSPSLVPAWLWIPVNLLKYLLLGRATGCP